MALKKEVKTKGYTSQPRLKSKEVDTTQPAVININDENFTIDGSVAKYILSLLERIDIMESMFGDYGES